MVKREEYVMNEEEYRSVSVTVDRNINELRKLADKLYDNKDDSYYPVADSIMRIATSLEMGANNILTDI